MSLQSTDQIADLITRIRNAIMVGKTEIRVPVSKLKVAVTEGLKHAGYNFARRNLRRRYARPHY